MRVYTFYQIFIGARDTQKYREVVSIFRHFFFYRYAMFLDVESMSIQMKAYRTLLSISWVPGTLLSAPAQRG